MMKKWGSLCLLVLCLWGCAPQEVFEQIEDVYQVMAPEAGQLVMTLPKEASVRTMGGEAGSIYFCDGYTLTVQTLAGGSLNGTLQTMTGYSGDALTVFETEPGRYECVWTSAGEGGDQVGRLLLLDDGVYHYVVTVMADAALAGSLRQVWDAVFNSVSLGDTGT